MSVIDAHLVGAVSIPHRAEAETGRSPSPAITAALRALAFVALPTAFWGGIVCLFV